MLAFPLGGCFLKFLLVKINPLLMDKHCFQFPIGITKGSLLKKFHLCSLLINLSANIAKWSNTLKQFVGKLPMNCLSVFDHFMGLVLKGSINLPLY